MNPNLESLPTPDRIAATIAAAIDRAEDRGSVICLAGRAFDALVELHGLDPRAAVEAMPLPLRAIDYDRQARRLGWNRQHER